MAKKRIPDRDAEDDSTDADAFRTAMRDVKPLAARPPRHVPPPAARRARVRAPQRGAAEDLDGIMPLIGTAAGEDAVASLSFQRGGVRDQVLRRLRRGLIPSEDDLDLHGLTQTEARDRLAQFIAHSRDAGRRCVRVVHGKGYRSGARGPILKTAVNLWLRRHLDVIAFTSARTIDGGTGAVYVLLRA
ncbi:MAG TPA: Smr/MutS family protein [Steroidobacteraceae bacterium]|jgi:DNA-nicking Smr family endonuclease